MSRARFGKLPPRYAFLLNPHASLRLSKCPTCQRLTHPRKFALLIHVNGWGPLLLGKTCKYCTLCELIMAHQDELEAELAHCFDRLAPEVIGEEYLVMGTIDKKVWRAGLEGEGRSQIDVLEHAAEFKKVLQMEVDWGGWRPAKETADGR